MRRRWAPAVRAASGHQRWPRCARAPQPADAWLHRAQSGACAAHPPPQRAPAPPCCRCWARYLCCSTPQGWCSRCGRGWPTWWACPWRRCRTRAWPSSSRGWGRAPYRWSGTPWVRQRSPWGAGRRGALLCASRGGTVPWIGQSWRLGQPGVAPLQLLGGCSCTLAQPVALAPIPPPIPPPPPTPRLDPHQHQRLQPGLLPGGGLSRQPAQQRGRRRAGAPPAALPPGARPHPGDRPACAIRLGARACFAVRAGSACACVSLHGASQPRPPAPAPSARMPLPQGLAGLAEGVAAGITGVVRAPMQGYSSGSGVLGGIGRGLLGAVGLPVRWGGAPGPSFVAAWLLLGCPWRLPAGPQHNTASPGPICKAQLRTSAATPTPSSFFCNAPLARLQRRPRVGWLRQRWACQLSRGGPCAAASPPWPPPAVCL